MTFWRTLSQQFRCFLRYKVHFYVKMLWLSVLIIVSNVICSPHIKMTIFITKVKSDHRSKFSNLINWKKSGLQRSPDFFRLLLSNCLNWKIYCDDHSSLSSTTAVQIWIISYKRHNIYYLAICFVAEIQAGGVR